MLITNFKDKKIREIISYPFCKILFNKKVTAIKKNKGKLNS